jgi:signal peptidase I
VLVVFKDASWRTWAKNNWERLQPVPNLLAVLLGVSSAATVLFGTMLAFYSVGSDSAMEPTLHQGDYVISVGNVLSGPVRHGDLVNIAKWRSLSPARVLGLPGDSVQVRSGQLILNGRAVTEPYRRQEPYRGDTGDFPLPTGAISAENPFHPIEATFAYEVAQRNRLDYVLPDHAYFVLNDDRNILEDSRQTGPVWDFQIAGRPFWAFNARRLWDSHRFVH